MKNAPCIYLLEPGNPLIDQYSHVLAQLYNDETPTLNLNVPAGEVEAGNVAEIQQLLMAMQHHPQLIGKMLFSINFNFAEITGSELFVPEQHWKTNPVYYRWFQELIEVPFILFFIADEDARFYALAADILEDGEVDAITDQSDGRTCITFSIEQTKIIEERLFNACCSLLLYCSGSGFNPKIYIEGVMALMNASFKYDDIADTCTELIHGSAPAFVVKRKDAA